MNTDDNDKFVCQNGEVSSIPCKKGWFGMTNCDDKQLQCEGKQFCCPKPGKPGSTTTSLHPETTTTPSNGTIGCEKCDLTARLSCFLTLHIFSNLSTTIGPQIGQIGEIKRKSPDCMACERCCDDAFQHKCEVWKNHDFCDMQWYSVDKKRILCGKTCGVC